VDDDVPGVDQHPIAMGHPFHPGAAIAVLLQGAQQVVGDGAHMPLRPARSDDQAIGHRALARKIDDHDILRLVLVKAAQNQVFEGLDATLDVRGGDGGTGGLLRALRGFTIQRETPLTSTRRPS